MIGSDEMGGTKARGAVTAQLSLEDSGWTRILAGLGIRNGKFSGQEKQRMTIIQLLSCVVVRRTLRLEGVGLSYSEVK